MMRKVIKQLLSTLSIQPILIDIGASAGPPRIWKEIAPYSIYVGFDPDRRELHELPDTRFYKAIIVNEAVTSDKTANEVSFHLTRSPYCSSILRPDSEALSNFLFSDLFIVESEIRVQSTGLDAVIERLSLPRLDWLKIDSQGTDLRLFNSLQDELRTRVLAVDIEPGLIDAYIGEDLFVDAHRELSRNGFWLSNLAVQGAVRMRKSTLDHIVHIEQGSLTPNIVEKVVRKSPGWVEARYFRTLEWLGQNHFDQRDYALLWIFALLDRQFGFALDLATEYERVFGRDKIMQIMQNEPILYLKRSRHIATLKFLFLSGIRRLTYLF
jgi:FkbM family methyltransferase